MLTTPKSLIEYALVQS